mmetsp:Transcript_24788/g.53604  ORF Transcript_24788/g.53604 Transcript_24788/m.53604 type:complete len:558 (-) Transcript_24788:1093-2766(-)
MSDTDIDEDDAYVAAQMADRRTKGSTKKGYQSKSVHVTLWFEKNRPDCIGPDGKIKIPIPTAAVIDFLGSICRGGYERSKVKDADEIPEDQAEPFAYSTLSSYRSVIKDLYRQVSTGSGAELDTEIRKVMVGYQKLLNELKKRGLFKITEGKQPLMSSGYNMLAGKLLSFNPTERPVGGQATTGSFAWAFFLLMWNLMSRTETVDAIMLQHMGWREDSLVIQEQGHKGDQTGEAKYWKHVYANPGDPEVCPVLALALVVFAGPARDTLGKQQIFLGSNNKDRFAKTLHQIIRALPEPELQLLGGERADIGPYSLRKGSASFCLGQVSGPNPFNDEGFAALPPHFCTEVLGLLTIDFWRTVVDGYDHYPNGFKSAFPFLLASLCYHETFLRDHLYSTHPIWNSRVYAQNPHLAALRAEGAVLSGIGFCPETGLKATGIPPHLLQLLAVSGRSCAATSSSTESRLLACVTSIDDLMRCRGLSCADSTRCRMGVGQYLVVAQLLLLLSNSPRGGERGTGVMAYCTTSPPRGGGGPPASPASRCGICGFMGICFRQVYHHI